MAYRSFFFFAHINRHGEIYTSLVIVTAQKTLINRIFILTFSSKLSIKIVCSAWSGTWIFSMALESKDLGAITMRSATWL